MVQLQDTDFCSEAHDAASCKLPDLAVFLKLFCIIIRFFTVFIVRLVAFVLQRRNKM